MLMLKLGGAQMLMLKRGAECLHLKQGWHVEVEERNLFEENVRKGEGVAPRDVSFRAQGFHRSADGLHGIHARDVPGQNCQSVGMFQCRIFR